MQHEGKSEKVYYDGGYGIWTHDPKKNMAWSVDDAICNSFRAQTKPYNTNIIPPSRPPFDQNQAPTP